MSDEGDLHDAIEKLRGEWVLKTDWGPVHLAFRPMRIGYGSARGTPDELLVVGLSFALFGEQLRLQAPILLEAEVKAGLDGALDDLKKFSQRSCAGEQESHIELPMLVAGRRRRTRSVDAVLQARIDIREVPAGSIR